MSQIKLLHSGGNGVILAAPTSNPSSDTTFKLPQADGSANEVLKTDGSGNLSFVAQPTGGLAVAQEWSYGSYPLYYQDAELNGTWNANAASVGSAMTVSSGVFTFPSTGIYKVHSSNTSLRISNESRYFTIFTYLSTDSGSNFTLQRENYGNINNDASSISTFTNTVILDITNTSTHKVKFKVGSETQISLSTTYVQFLKLGDT